MAVDRKVEDVDVPVVAEKLAVETKHCCRGDKFDVAKFAKENNTTTDVICKYVYPHALLVHDIPPLELITSPSFEDRDIVKVNAKNCIILKKGQHPFLQDVEIKIRVEGGKLILEPSMN